MFAPDQARAARELLRVCRPGGRIALASWTPDGFVGRLFQTAGRHVPPPPGLRSPAAWGTEERLGELLGGEARELRVRPRDYVFRYRSAAHWLEVFRTWYGPVHRAFQALAPEARPALERDILALLEELDVGAGGKLAVPSAYLEAVVTRA
jgi:SAM-dependent methyltransferase